jgi:DNA-directed RNA polymerase specialized sigma24 family protein
MEGVSSLPAAEREIFQALVVDEKDYEQVARETGQTDDQLAALLGQALERLGQHLGRKPGRGHSS